MSRRGPKRRRETAQRPRSGAGKHTIVLMQPERSPKSRTFSDYETVNSSMEGILKMYEQHLKRKNPRKRDISYDIEDLYDHIDSLPDISCLVYSDEIKGYVPHSRDWIKTRIEKHLRKIAGQT